MAIADSAIVRSFADYIAPSLPPGLRVALWNGSVFESGRTAVCTVTFFTPLAANAFLAAKNDRELADIYVTGLVDIDGDLRLVFTWLTNLRRAMDLPRLVRLWLTLKRQRKVLSALSQTQASRHTASKWRNPTERISFHYDKPVEFWRLWLDPLLQYTCAYYTDQHDSLETAQQNKLELILAKLDLADNDRLLDMGCGWGGLLRYACASRRVRCTGVTLSRSQFDFASQDLGSQIASGRCNIALGDLRTFNDEPFAGVTAVGVLEHMGPAQASNYFESAYRQLIPGGRFLSQAICWAGPAKLDRTNRFLDAYVFPGGRLLTISEAAAVAESVGFEVLHIENLRLHYIETLIHWRQAFEREQTALVNLVGEDMYRIFRLYLAGSEHRFLVGKIGVHQLLLKRPGTIRTLWKPALTGISQDQ